jgi:hypothetical protein
MAFAVTSGRDPSNGFYVVAAKVALSFAETNALFLSGDSIVSWPEGVVLTDQSAQADGAQGATGEAGLVRTGMFISELARLPEGLKIGYRQAADAQRSAQLVRLQLLRAGLREES